MNDIAPMIETASLKAMMSGPSLLASAGILAGGTAALIASYNVLPLPHFVVPLALSLGASALVCALVWTTAAGMLRHQRRLLHIETALQRLERSLVTAQLQRPTEMLPEPEPIETHQTEVAAELRMLQHLLGQVLERRKLPPAQPFTDPPTLRLVSESPQSAPAVEADTNTLAIMRSALEDSRIDLHLQPMVKLPSRRVTHYEAFSRVRDENGTVIFPQTYLQPAESAGLVGTLDNLLLFRCITLIRNLGPRKPGTRLFVNLALGSLRDEEFLTDFVAYMAKHQELSARLVFELAARDLAELDSNTLTQLARLTRAGFSFSIDLGESFDLPEDVWPVLNIQFVKIRASYLADHHTSFDWDRLRKLAHQYRAALVATHIEDERGVIDVLELGVEYGQGYLFGKPRLAREDLTVSKAA